MSMIHLLKERDRSRYIGMPADVAGELCAVDAAVDRLLQACSTVWRNTNIDQDDPKAIAAVVLASNDCASTSLYRFDLRPFMDRLVAFLAASGRSDSPVYSALTDGFAQQHAGRLASHRTFWWECVGCAVELSDSGMVRRHGRGDLDLSAERGQAAADVLASLVFSGVGGRSMSIYGIDTSIATVVFSGAADDSMALAGIDLAGIDASKGAHGFLVEIVPNISRGLLPDSGHLVDPYLGDLYREIGKVYAARPDGWIFECAALWTKDGVELKNWRVINVDLIEKNCHIAAPSGRVGAAHDIAVGAFVGDGLLPATLCRLLNEGVEPALVVDSMRDRGVHRTAEILSDVARMLDAGSVDAPARPRRSLRL